MTTLGRCWCLGTPGQPTPKLAPASSIFPTEPREPSSELALTLERVENGEEVEHEHRGGAVGEERQGPGGSQQAEEPHCHQGHLPGLAVPLHCPCALQAAALPGHYPEDSHIEEEDEAKVAAVGDVVDQEIFGSDPAPEKRQLRFLQQLCQPWQHTWEPPHGDVLGDAGTPLCWRGLPRPRQSSRDNGVWIHSPKAAQPGEAPGEPWMSLHDLEACGHDQGGLAADVVVATDVESSCVVIRIREAEAQHKAKRHG